MYVFYILYIIVINNSNSISLEKSSTNMLQTFMLCVWRWQLWYRLMKRRWVENQSRLFPLLNFHRRTPPYSSPSLLTSFILFLNTTLLVYFFVSLLFLSLLFSNICTRHLSSVPFCLCPLLTPHHIFLPHNLFIKLYVQQLSTLSVTTTIVCTFH